MMRKGEKEKNQAWISPITLGGALAVVFGLSEPMQRSGREPVMGSEEMTVLVKVRKSGTTFDFPSLRWHRSGREFQSYSIRTPKFKAMFSPRYDLTKLRYIYKEDCFSVAHLTRGLSKLAPPLPFFFLRSIADEARALVR